MKALCVLVLLVGLAGAPKPAAASSPDAAADIDAFIRRAMAEVETVPGLSIAVVQGDAVVMTAGYGVADVVTRRPVDADTRFYIASATKSFTALAFAARATRGELDLDAPLSCTYPDSGLSLDIAGSTSLTDLLVHRSGLSNNALTFRYAYSGDAGPETMRRLAAETRRDEEAPPGVFRYSNLGYNLATTLAGGDWRALVQDEVLTPAGLSRTTASIAEARRTGFLALGHFGDRPDGPRVSPLQKTDATMHSAGGLVSTAHDMARWLELQLNDGVIDGERVFPAGLVASTHQMRVGQERRFGDYHRDGYGLGWNLGSYRGERLVHHFGNFSGSRAHVSFMPDHRIGVAVMVNEDLAAGELADVVANHVYDRLLDRPDLVEASDDAIAGLRARRDQRRSALAAARAERATRPWRLSRSASSYAGAYDSARMGTLRLEATPDGLVATMGPLRALAEPYDEAETVRVELVPFQGETLRFEGRDRLVFAGEVFRRR